MAPSIKKIAPVRGPIGSLFEDGTAAKVIDFLAVQLESQTRREICEGIIMNASDEKIDRALRQLVKVDVIGTNNNSVNYIRKDAADDNRYYLRNDTPAAKAIIHFYNYVNNLDTPTRVLCSSLIIDDDNGY